MRFLLSPWNPSYLYGLGFLLSLACTQQQQSVEQQEIDSSSEAAFTRKVDTINTLTPNKLELTRAYSKHHYGLDTYKLDTPKMVVIHYTVIPTLEETIELFQRETLASNRTFINQFSALNVGIHYVIDQDGSIYHLLPDSIMARHLIGFNHVSIGIENIARDETELTPEQLSSNVDLVRFLAQKHPTIDYLIGHDEYNDPDLPHYELLVTRDTTYQPYDKPDPGAAFMSSLREQLSKEHDLAFKK